MPDYDMTDEAEVGDVHVKLNTIKLTFDETQDVNFFLGQLDMRLECAGIKSQWWKRHGLSKYIAPEGRCTV